MTYDTIIIILLKRLTLLTCLISTMLQVKTDENEDEWLFFRVAEAIFVGWFTIEYLVRFVVAPQKVRSDNLLIM